MNDLMFTATYTQMPHYQVYYWTALSKVGAFTLQNAPMWYRLFSQKELSLDLEAFSESLKGSFGFRRNWDSPENQHFAGLYSAKNRRGRMDFAIDTHDSKEIVSPSLQKRCGIYFKANKWAHIKYPDNVFPIVNGNGFLRNRHLMHLKRMRDQPKTNDLIFVSRIWGGVEHNVRLFEALSKLRCRKKLLAIFVEGVTDRYETAEARDRLESLGIECTTDLIPIKKLWMDTARSKVVILRAGKHMCIPWRMIDLLCLGACIVTDAEFLPQWPVPLVSDAHYCTAGLRRPEDTSPADSEEYDKLNGIIEDILADDNKRRFIESSSAQYFDDHAASGAVGNYILSCVENYLDSNC